MSSIQPLSQISIENIQYDAKIRNEHSHALEKQYAQDIVELSEEAIRMYEEGLELKDNYAPKPDP
tara:strand:- start:222 stop:416 length:195 start_codon:yes stop_codon:yes gene_type:complete